MNKIYPYIRPFIGALIFATVIKGAGAITDISIPYFMGKVIDEGIAAGQTGEIIKLCVIMFLLAAATLAFNLWANNLSAKVANNMGESIRNHLFQKIQRLTVRDVDRYQTGTLITRMTNDVEQVQRTLLMMSRVFIRAPLLAVGGVSLSLLTDPVLTCVIFAGMAATGVISAAVFRLTRPVFIKAQKSIDRLTTILREDLAGIRVIKSFVKSLYEVKRFDRQSKKIKDNEMKAGAYNAFLGPTIALTNSITVAALLMAGYYRMKGGSLEIGGVVTIVNYVNQVLMAMSAVPRIFMLYSRANISSGRIGEVMDTPDETEFGEKISPAPNFKYVLELKDVSFTYADGEAEPEAEQNVPYALKNITFNIKPGETVAVIGGTGSGKTTLLNIILRLYEPSNGKIFLQGREISEYTKEYLYENVTAALQQYNIFAMSIGENIVLERELDEARRERSAQSAQLMDLINREGFDYKITQTGTNISGGQKQRVSVSRTLYREAALTVLDDVSSSLDYQTDLRLRKALRETYKGKSVLLIAQRVSSIRGADKIIVLRKGRVAGIGTHDELISSCEEYKDICKTQGVEVSNAETIGVETSDAEASGVKTSGAEVLASGVAADE